MEVDNINKSIDNYIKTSYEKFENYDRFKFLINNLSKSLDNNKSLLDIGCAKGELLFLLKKQFPGLTMSGVDISEELIARANKEPSLNGVKFFCDDACNFDLQKRFDITVMSGVLSIFDDIVKPLHNMIKHTKVGGRGYIFGGFVSENIDIIVRFRNNYTKSQVWESGWNMFSLETVQLVLSPYASDIKIIQFNPTVNLDKTENPVNSYSLNLTSGEKIYRTGGNIIREFYLIEFTKK